MEFSQSKYSNSDKNSIKSMISRCSPTNCSKIYDMLILDNIKMTKNNNGYFLNLSNVCDETIDKIKNMLDTIQESNNNMIISNNIENDYQQYSVGEIKKNETVQTTQINNIEDIDENENENDNDNENIIDNPTNINENIEVESIINDDIDEEINYYFDNDDNDDISTKHFQKKQELSPYLSKLIKKCKDIQKNNEMDNIDNIDDLDDCDYVFDANQELSLDLTYSI